jgi:polar amino acid transport system substrate-binding protein/arginine/ornithine transport system substrate-binding protein
MNLAPAVSLPFGFTMMPRQAPVPANTLQALFQEQPRPHKAAHTNPQERRKGMINRRSILAGIAAVMFAYASPAWAEGTLRVAISTGYPPFDILNADGTYGGFDVEFAKLICERTDKTCEFTDIEWDGIIPGLLAKKYDVIIASMGINEERMKQVDFTDTYYKGPSALIAKKDAGFTADEAGTTGKAIGVQRATAHECYMKKHMAKAEMRQYATSEEAYLDLQAGRIDAVLVDTIPGETWLKSDQKNAEAFAPVKADLYDQECFGIGQGIALRKGEDALKAELNAAIKKTREDGSYLELSNRYFGRDIFDF